MKKTILTLVALLMSVASWAQFEEGKIYANAALSGFGMEYTGAEDWKIDLNLKGGYFFDDNWLIYGQLGYNYRDVQPNEFLFGAGFRYYFMENGLFLGATANYHSTSLEGKTVNDFMPSAHIGYAFFLSRTVTIEPELYYNQSLKDHDNLSGLGVRIGVGIYLE